MSKTRPSIGEFSGYFNISSRDRVRLGGESHFNLHAADTLPDLTKEEVLDIRRNIAPAIDGWTQIPDAARLPYLWPAKYFAYDEVEIIDRTLNIHFATCRDVTSALISQLQAILVHYCTWRSVLRFPRGDDADLTLYYDAVLIGDDLSEDLTTLDSAKNRWLAAERRELEHRANQVTQFGGNNPLCFLDESREVMQFAFFTSQQRSSGAVNNSATIWFGSCGSLVGKVPHQIRCLRIADQEYRPSIFTLSGVLDREAGWRFDSPSQSSAELLPFAIPQSSEGERFELIGIHNSTFEKWSVEGIIGRKSSETSQE